MKHAVWFTLFGNIILFFFTKNAAMGAGHDNNPQTVTPFPACFTKLASRSASPYIWALRGGPAEVFIGHDRALFRYMHNSSRSADIFWSDTSGSESTDVFILEIDYTGANPYSTLVESSPSGAYCNYVFGNDPAAWISGQEMFGSVTCRDLYPGIDLQYHSVRPRLKTDYIVHAGADPSVIRLRYSGADSIWLDRDGSLKVMTKAGLYAERIPRAYQVINGKEVDIDVGYRIDHDTCVGFFTAYYDPGYDLIIDPVLVFSTFIGGSGDDLLYTAGLCRDAAGYIYVTARTGSTDFPVTPGAYDITYNGGQYDAIVMKLSPDGDSIKYCTYLGGSAYDVPTDLELTGPDGSLVVEVLTQSSDFPVTPGVYQTVFNGGVSDISLVKLDAAGYPVFATFIGGTGDDLPFSLAIDSAGYLYFSGQTKGNFPVTGGAFQTTHGGIGYYDIMVGKMNPSGTNLVWATYLGGPTEDKGSTVLVDENGYVYVCGICNNGYPVTAGAYDVSFNGGSYDVCVSKLSPDGSSLVYSTYIGGNGTDFPKKGFVVDQYHQVTLTGYCYTGYPTTAGSYNQVNQGVSDMFLTRMNAAGSQLVFSTIIGTPLNDEGKDILIRPDGNIILTGIAGPGFPVTPCAWDTTFNGGNYDAIISVFNPDASQLLYSTYFGGLGEDHGVALLDDEPYVYLYGETASSDLPVSPGSFDTTHNAGWDLFFLKMELTEETDAGFQVSQPACAGDTVFFTANATNPAFSWWSFGDQDTSLQVNPRHVYLNPGVYQVLHIINENCGTGIVADTSGTFVSVYAPYYHEQHLEICQGDSMFLAGAYQHTTGIYTDSSFTFHGCDSIVVSNLVVHPLPAPDLGPDTVICPYQSVTISPGPGYTGYLWNTGSQKDSLLVAQSGVFWVKVTDTNSCTQYDTVQVVVVPEPAINLGNDTVVCIGLSVNLNPGQGFNTFIWNTGATSPLLTILNSGIYSVTVTYNGYCLGSDSILVDFQPGNMITLGPDSIICSGSSAILGPGPGYAQYAWSTGQNLPAINVSQPGIYSVSVTRPDGCYDADTVEIFVTPAPVNIVDTTICTGNQYYAGGSWQNSPGTYIDTLHFNTDCDSVVITHLSVLTKYLHFLGNDTSFCSGDTVYLTTGTAFSSYYWNTTATVPVIAASSGGLYSVTVSDSSACLGFDTVVLIQYQSFLQHKYPGICQGDSLFAGGYYQYAQGIYPDTLHSIHGCDSIWVTHLSVYPVYQQSQQQQICDGDSLFVAGAYRHLPGNYYDSLGTVHGCDSVIITQLVVHPLPLQVLPPDTSFCRGDTIIISAGNPGCSYIWNTGATTQALLVSNKGLYCVTITSNENCTLHDSLFAAFRPDPVVVVLPHEVVLCRDSSVLLYAHGAFTYSWSPAAGLQFISDSVVIASPPGDITYIVTGTGLNGCEADTSVSITLTESPAVILGPDQYLCEGDELTLNPGPCYPCRYLWNTGDTTGMITVYNPGIYWVMAYNDGCAVRDSLKIKECTDLEIPNVFTPNGDGKNETFKIKAGHFEKFRMYIYNRWGSLLFETSDQTRGWDGTAAGNPSPDGVYYFLITFESVTTGGSSTAGHRRGAVTLLR